MLDAEETQHDSRTFPYQYKSVGAMLLNALGNQSDTILEVLQSHFKYIYQYFERTAKVEYEESNDVILSSAVPRGVDARGALIETLC